jgi:uncharacterized membrane protein HdeD (DUF308 family)
MKIKFLKVIIKLYCLIVAILTLIIYLVAINHYGKMTIAISGIFAILLGVVPYFQFNSIVGYLKKLRNNK